MFLARVTISLRRSILDPQGKAVHHALESLGMKSVREVRIGKHIDLTIDTTDRDEAARIAEEACRKLLANPVMEDFSYTVEEVDRPWVRG